MTVGSDLYLSHHGILGMKWGVRRTPEQLGHRTKKLVKQRLKEKEKRETEEKKSSDKATIKSMTDDELRAVINRLQLEKQLRDLTKPELTAGQKWINSVLNESSKKIATAYLTKTATKALDSLLESASKKTKSGGKKK